LLFFSVLFKNSEVKAVMNNEVISNAVSSLAALVKTSTIAPCMHANHSGMTVPDVRGSTPGTDSRNSGFHPFEVDK